MYIRQFYRVVVSCLSAGAPLSRGQCWMVMILFVIGPDLLSCFWNDWDGIIEGVGRWPGILTVLVSNAVALLVMRLESPVTAAKPLES